MWLTAVPHAQVHSCDRFFAGKEVQVEGGATLPKEPKVLAFSRKLHLILHEGFSGKRQPCHGAPREEVGVTSALRQRQCGVQGDCGAGMKVAPCAAGETQRGLPLPPGHLTNQWPLTFIQLAQEEEERPSLLAMTTRPWADGEYILPGPEDRTVLPRGL